MARTAWRCALVILAGVLLCAAVETAVAAKRVSIPDDLRDVVDDEEDDDWRHWGTAAPPRDDGPPPDLAGMDPAALQAELLRRHAGPSFGFVKLRLGVRRSQEEVMGIATRWTNVLRTGSVAAKFVAVDFGTLMFTMDRGQDILESSDNWVTLFKVKEFILSQPEAYEFKIGNQAFRRPGDPPLDEVVEMLQKQKSTMLSQDPGSQQYKSKVEL
uniref:Mesoderm development candidate 2 n=1 Tax=Oryza glumipatula TaxID=40148 RepID=A0A0D9Z232_9ORYZ